MATIETFKVNKGLKYLAKARGVGYYDYVQIFNGSEEDTAIELSAMTPYDGLSMTQIKGVESADTVDFTNTILPWKWQYQKYLSTSKFALMPLGNYDIALLEINANTIGTLTNNDGVISGFSITNSANGDYLTLAEPFNPQDKPWEVGMKVTTGTDFSHYPQMFASNPAESKYGIGFSVTPQNVFNFYSTYKGGAWDFDLMGTHTVQTNTTYWVKAGWTGTEYYFEYSLDGVEYVRDITHVSTTPTYSSLTRTAIGGFWVGLSSLNVLVQSIWTGSIDLKECYAKINNETVWKGLRKECVGNFTKVGNVFINKDGKASNFSINNYIITPTFNPANNPWEVRIKFTPKYAYVNAADKLFGSHVQANKENRYGINLAYTNTFIFAVSAENGSYKNNSTGTYIIQPNTTYWIKFGWSGTEYYLDVSTNGTEYIRDITVLDVTPVYNQMGFTSLGGGYVSDGWNDFNGTIDLSETELLINGETFYKPEVTYVTNTVQGCLYNYTDNGQATTLNCFAVNGDESVILTPDTSYNNERFLGTVNIAEHDVYDYNDGEWRKK